MRSFLIAVYYREKLQSDPDRREFGHQGIRNRHARSQLQKFDRFGHFEATGGRSAPQNEGQMVKEPYLNVKLHEMKRHII